MNNYFWDENKTRYNLIRSNPGKNYNWLFFPGGPGSDSWYMRDLVKELDIPGNIWLIDLPNNGNNLIHEEYDFNQWFELLVPIVKKFRNPIYVGHSAGGMFPLLLPELESHLKGLVLLATTPSIWHEEAHKASHIRNKPSYEKEMQAFVKNPTKKLFTEALLACAPYYFTDKYLEVGKEMLRKLPCNYSAAFWWQVKVEEIKYDAKWIPQKVPTLILGGSEDCICPPSMFEKDKRFKRDNITINTLKDAGHMPWIEDITSVKKVFVEFSMGI